MMFELILVIVGLLAVLAMRFKRCPSDKILVIYGKTTGGRSSRCIHGGAAFVWPMIQAYQFLDLTPIPVDIRLEGALSKQNIRINTPSTFTVGISTEKGVMETAADRLLGLSLNDIQCLCQDIIFGQMRLVIATMPIEEINADRDKLIENISNGVEVELRKVGIRLINVNIQNVTDESGYIDALGKDAAAQAIDEANEQLEGEMGKARVDSASGGNTDSGLERSIEELLNRVVGLEKKLKKNADQGDAKLQKTIKVLRLLKEDLESRDIDSGEKEDSSSTTRMPESTGSAPSWCYSPEEVSDLIAPVPAAPAQRDETDAGGVVVNRGFQPPAIEKPKRARKGAVPSRPKKKATPIDVIIGLDFGTSRCKVVMSSKLLPGSPAYPVVFDTEDDCPFLLPTNVSQSPEGVFSLEPLEGYELLQDLKVALMDHPDEGDSMVNAVGYLALVLKYSRDWLVAGHKDVYGQSEIIWSMNMGLPSNGSEDKEMRGVFRLVGEAAWSLSMGKGSVTVTSARDALTEAKESNPEDETEVDLREEVIAEVQGYCRSYMRRLGLHVIVDVGASTLDACGFTLYENSDGDSGQALLAPVVERLGSRHLLQAKDQKGIISKDFQRDCIRAFHKAMIALVQDKDPNSAVFKRNEKLRVFICGGGGQDPFYEKKVVRKVEKHLDDMLQAFGGFNIQPIPCPKEIEWPAGIEIKKENYHRIAVAYGLSLSSDDVGHIVPPGQVGDISAPETLPAGRLVGPEQV